MSCSGVHRLLGLWPAAPPTPLLCGCRAAKLQGGLAFLGSHAAMIAAAKAASKAEKQGWRAAGLVLGAVWPWTVFAMLPLNKTILQQVGGTAAPVACFLSSMLPNVCGFVQCCLPRAPVQTDNACVPETHPSSPVQQEHALTQGGHIRLPAEGGWLRPVCRTLQDEKDPAQQEAQLARWNRLHWVRTGLSLTSLAVMLATVLGTDRS